MVGEGTIASLLISLGLEDNASAGLQKVDETLGETSMQFEEAKEHADNFGGSLEDSATKSISFSDKIGKSATSLAEVGHSADKVMGMFDRLQISDIALENSTMRVTTAQENYNDAVQKYGPNSKQAEDAARSLEIANNNLEKTNIRAEMSMGMIGISALSMVPQFISAGTAVMTFAASGSVITTLAATTTTAMAAISAGVAFATASATASITALSAFLFTNPVGIALLLIVGAIVALKLAWDNNFMGIQQTLGSAVAYLKEHLGWLGDAIGWVGDKLGGLLPHTAAAAASTETLTTATGAANAAMSNTPVVIMASTTALGKLSDAEYAAQQKVNELTKAHAEGKATMDQVIGAKEELRTATTALTDAEGKQKAATDASTTSIEAMRSATISAAKARYDAYHAGDSGSDGGSSGGGGSGPTAGKVQIGTSYNGRNHYWADSRELGGGQTTYDDESGTYSQNKDWLIGQLQKTGRFIAAAEGASFMTSGPTSILAGEGGEPEYVSITPQSKMSGGSGAINITINTGNVYGVDDLQRTIQEAMSQIHTNIRAAGG